MFWNISKMLLRNRIAERFLGDEEAQTGRVTGGGIK
jgi:hypothetical protein